LTAVHSRRSAASLVGLSGDYFANNRNGTQHVREYGVINVGAAEGLHDVGLAQHGETTSAASTDHGHVEGGPAQTVVTWSMTHPTSNAVSWGRQMHDPTDDYRDVVSDAPHELAATRLGSLRAHRPEQVQPAALLCSGKPWS
jgi:hypothetical protein